MKISSLLLLLLLALSAPLAVSQGKAYGGARLLLAGLYHGDEVSAGSGSGWFGLYGKEGDFELAPTAIKVEAAFDAVMDEEGRKTGKRFSDLSGREPIFLVKGPKLASGPVKAFFSGDLDLSAVGTPAIFSAPDNAGALHISGVRDAAEKSLIRDYELEIIRGDKRQTLLALDQFYDGVSPRLLWAGDLDRDGRTDFFFDLSTQENVRLFTLYPSSRAAPPGLAGKAAEFRHVGC
ncbi:MAG TPA: hypothetical protein VM658_09920 [bacterium]|nr:hypothetical protein [bacterium]